MDPTHENVLAARKAADKAEDKCTKMARYVAEMQGWRDHYKNETVVCKEEKKAEAEGNFIMYNQLLSDAHTKWTEALNSQAELWQKYCDLLDEYQKLEKEREERADALCTFCGEMERECGGDHGDEMRDIGREHNRDEM